MKAEIESEVTYGPGLRVVAERSHWKQEMIWCQDENGRWHECYKSAARLEVERRLASGFKILLERGQL